MAVRLLGHFWALVRFCWLAALVLAGVSRLVRGPRYALQCDPPAIILGVLLAALSLARAAAVPEEAPLRAASASFFKNCVVRGWDSGGDEGKPAVRAALLEALCCATESAVLRVLADAFRWVAQADFARHAKGADGAMEGTAPPAPRWASLVAELQRALKASNLMPGADGALHAAA